MAAHTEELSTMLDANAYIIPEGGERAFFIHDERGEDDGEQIEPHTPDQDDLIYTPDVMDPYVGSEVRIPSGDGYIAARVRKRARGTDGNPIGRANDNPILDTRLYEVEQGDGTVRELQANIISENLFSQADLEGHQIMLMDEITGHKKDGSAITRENGFITTASGQQ